MLARLGKYLYLKHANVDLKPLILEQMGLRRDFVDINSLSESQRINFLKKCHDYYNDTDGLMLILSNLIEQQLYDLAIYRSPDGKAINKDGDFQRISITTIGVLKNYLEKKAIEFEVETAPEEPFDPYKIT